MATFMFGMYLVVLNGDCPILTDQLDLFKDCISDLDHEDGDLQCRLTRPCGSSYI